MTLNELHPTLFLLQLPVAVDHICSTVELEIVFLVFAVKIFSGK